MASQLKRQLMALNNMTTIDQTATNSKSSKGAAKPGGSAQYFTKDKTGADRSPIPTPAKKSAPTGKKVQVTYSKHPTGKAAPKGVNPGAGPAKMSGKVAKLYGL